MLNRYLTKIKSSKLKRTYLQSKSCVGMRVAETCCWETLSRLPYKMPVRASSRSHRHEVLCHPSPPSWSTPQRKAVWDYQVSWKVTRYVEWERESLSEGVFIWRASWHESREYREECNEHAERKNRTKGNCRHLRALQDDDDQLEIPGTCKK